MTQFQKAAVVYPVTGAFGLMLLLISRSQLSDRGPGFWVISGVLACAFSLFGIRLGIKPKEFKKKTSGTVLGLIPTLVLGGACVAVFRSVDTEVGLWMAGSALLPFGAAFSITAGVAQLSRSSRYHA